MRGSMVRVHQVSTLFLTVSVFCYLNRSNGLASSLAAIISSQSRDLTIKACSQCGVTDKTLSACGRCHIEKYCSRCSSCCLAQHKLVCVAGVKEEGSLPQKSASDTDEIFHFHPSQILTEYLSTKAVFKMQYFWEKGIAQAIIGLAAKRFANKNLDMINIKLGVMTIFLDLTKGKDGFTGDKLLKVALPQITLDLLADTLEKALVNSTKNKQDDGKIKG